jgi:hypothetical protein
MMRQQATLTLLKTLSQNLPQLTMEDHQNLVRTVGVREDIRTGHLRIQLKIFTA